MCMKKTEMCILLSNFLLSNINAVLILWTNRLMQCKPYNYSNRRTRCCIKIIFIQIQVLYFDLFDAYSHSLMHITELSSIVGVDGFIFTSFVVRSALYILRQRRDCYTQNNDYKKIITIASQMSRQFCTMQRRNISAYLNRIDECHISRKS